jgi:hypothetical protein
MKRTIFGVLLVAACGFAQAADKVSAQQGPCDALAGEVEASVKELAYYSINGTLDDSAPRETNRKLQKVVASNLIQSNLVLMQANKCPMPKLPIYESAYRSAALKCFTAEQPKEGIALECVRTKWTRNTDY